MSKLVLLLLRMLQFVLRLLHPLHGRACIRRRIQLVLGLLLSICYMTEHAVGDKWLFLFIHMI